MTTAEDPTRSIERPLDRRPNDLMPRREWLVTNGLGGYASGTVAGVMTRRYHGLLIASLPSPLGRTVMLNHVHERVRVERAGAVGPGRTRHLVEFRLELGLPVWRYSVDGIEIEKRVVMPHGQNTVHVAYRIVKGDRGARLALRPLIHFRSHEAPVNASEGLEYSVTARERRYEVGVTGDGPVLRLLMYGSRGALILDAQDSERVSYAMEGIPGYHAEGSLWSPGYFRADLSPEEPATLVASTESWEVIAALHPADAHTAETERRRRLLTLAGAADGCGLDAELVLAADQFIITPAGRAEEAARAHAAGEEVRTIIAGYHWFTDWGRDTMISLEGLTLCTRRFQEASYILRTFAHYVRDGLIPNMFPDGAREGLYNTADATLWLFHAMERYVRTTGDVETLRELLPEFVEIVTRHLEGTCFGIGVDPSDGLLRQGAEGCQLTWMDAKVDAWVVTPRRGKAVEINALWYNALRLLEGWIRQHDHPADIDLDAHARRARESFNLRFWSPSDGFLFDVVDGEQGDDPACRPNQLFAVSLDHPVLDRAHWKSVVDVVKERLLTPYGLRSLAPGHPDYKAKYYGDLRSRDAAYHQGTVWAWLIGPFVDAWLRVHPEDREGARRFLQGFDEHLGEACVGSISEIFDADPPFIPRGCVAQAWSVAEVLRCLDKTGPA